MVRVKNDSLKSENSIEMNKIKREKDEAEHKKYRRYLELTKKITRNQANDILDGLEEAKNIFVSKVQKKQDEDLTLYPYGKLSNQYWNNVIKFIKGELTYTDDLDKEFYDGFENYYRSMVGIFKKTKQIKFLVDNYKGEYDSDMLKNKHDIIVEYPSKHSEDREDELYNYYYQISNLKMSTRIERDLNHVIDEFFDDIEKQRPSNLNEVAKKAIGTEDKSSVQKIVEDFKKSLKPMRDAGMRLM